MKHRLGLLGFGAAALALTACGGGGSSSDATTTAAPVTTAAPTTAPPAATTVAPTTTTAQTTTTAAPTTTEAPTTTTAAPTTTAAATTTTVGLAGLKFALPSYVPADATYEDSDIDTDPTSGPGYVAVRSGGKIVAVYFDAGTELAPPDETITVDGVDRFVRRNDDGDITAALWPDNGANLTLAFVNPLSDDDAATLIRHLSADSPSLIAFDDSDGFTHEALPPLVPSWYSDLETDEYSAEISVVGGTQEELDALLAIADLFDDATSIEDTTIRGLPGKILRGGGSDMTDTGEGAEQITLVWYEDGSLFSVDGTFPEAEMRKIAESLEFVDQDTWQAAMDA